MLTARSAGRVSNRVITVARLAIEDSYKGVDNLIQAWPQVINAVPDAELRIVGDGNGRQALEGLSHGAGVSSSIRFLGRLSDGELLTEYERASVFALPGRTLPHGTSGEGYGIVFLEAAAAGLPCVAGAAAGAVDAVVDGETGFHVDPYDFRHIAGTIVLLLRDQPLREQMGLAGVKRVLREHTDANFFMALDSIIGRDIRVG